MYWWISAIFSGLNAAAAIVCFCKGNIWLAALNLTFVLLNALVAVVNFKEQNKRREVANMNDTKELSKVVKVSDPECWYNRDKVIVKLFICPEYKGVITVRLLVESIDDFAMEYSRDCYSSEHARHTYNLMKDNLFDKLPKEISYNWLLEHGYFPY